MANIVPFEHELWLSFRRTIPIVFHSESSSLLLLRVFFTLLKSRKNWRMLLRCDCDIWMNESKNRNAERNKYHYRDMFMVETVAYGKRELWKEKKTSRQFSKMYAFQIVIAISNSWANVQFVLSLVHIFFKQKIKMKEDMEAITQFVVVFSADIDIYIFVREM